ncbi:MAG: hypothetical protein IJJ26_08465 [Victivallales bacterium]|nr:hypothetical protein [Victivallales bacterium]
MDDFHSISQPGRKVLVRAGWEFLLNAPLEQEGTCVVSYPDRSVRRLETPQGVVYVKFFREDVQSSLLRRFRHFLRNLFGSCKTFRLVRLHQELRDAGFLCPEPVLAELRGKTQIFATREVPGMLVRDALQSASTSDDARRHILQTAATAIRSLHNAGFVHGDCLPGNLSIDGDQIYFLDNDRTRCPHFRSSHERTRNLIQFCAHLPAAPSSLLDEETRVFLESYGTPSAEQLLPVIESRRQEIARQRKK